MEAGNGEDNYLVAQKEEQGSLEKVVGDEREKSVPVQNVHNLENVGEKDRNVVDEDDAQNGEEVVRQNGEDIVDGN